MTGIPVPSQQDPQRPAAVNAPSTPPLPTGIFDMPIQSGGSLDLGPLDRGVPATPAWRLGADSNALAELDARDAEARLRAGETPTLDDLIDAERSQQDQMLALHFREAAKADPAIAGEAQRIGVELEKMGASPLRPIIVERNIEKMRGILSQRRAEMAAAAVDSPTLRRKMSDPDFARIAFDQTDNLSFFGKLVANYDVGKLQVQRGLLGDRFRRGIGTESDLTELERVQEQLAKLPASSGNPLNGLFRFVGQFGQTLPRALGAAGAGGGAAVALGQLPGLTFLPEEAVSVPTMATVGFLTEMWASSAKQQSGAMYLDMVDQGFDAYTSANISGAFGIVGGALDVVGFGTLAAPAKGLILQSAKQRVVDLLAKPTLAGAAKSFGSSYAIAQGGEMGTELLQTINEIIAKEIARPEGQPGITAEEFGQQIGDTIVETFNMTAIAGGLAPSARYMSDRRKVAEAKAMGDTINRFLTKADEVRAEWVKRNPEAFGEATEEVLKEAGAPDTFYVDASKVGDILRQSDKAEAQQGFNPDTAAQVDAAIPGFSASVTQAEAEGGDVMVPAKLFVQQFGDTAFAKSLAPHLRASPNALSVTEAVEVEKQLKQADDKAERAMMEELAAVQDNFQRKLAETTDLPHDQQRHTAAIYRLMVEQLAREEKIPVAQAATLVFGQDQDADALNQPPLPKTDTPEFKEWFGEPKVVDDAGKPLVVYHGTAASFTEFGDGPRSAKLDSGFLGSGYYFTSRTDVADYYAGRHGGDKAQVYPVYVALRNPFMWGAKTNGVRGLLMRGDQLPAGLTEAVLRRSGVSPMADPTVEYSSTDEQALADALRDELKSRGFDGVIAEVDGGFEVVAFDPTQIKSVNNRGTFDPNDPNILRQPGRGGFDPKRLAAIFTKKDANGRGSDASTIVHELVHWHVEMMARLAAAGSAFGQEMFGTLLQRWNITREQYDAMSAAERKPLLEEVSYNVEDYFESGKAPSNELRRLFERIRSFMLAVYSDIRQQLNKAYRDEFGVDLPALTPELRGYFDRMLASREAIAAAEADRDMAALFMDEDARKAAGVTDAKWAEIQKLDDAARDEAVADLASRAVRGLGAFDGARMRTVKALQQKLKATRAKVREQAEADVRARPVYASQAQIRYGEAIDDEGNAQSSKLDTDAVRAILGDDAELAAYEAQRDAARAAAMEAAGNDAERIAEGQAPAVAAEVARNRAALEKERAAFEKQATEQAKEKVGAEPVYRAISFIENGTIDDNGVSMPARLDRGAVRLLAGKTKLGAASEVFDRIPAKLLRKGGASPDIVAAMFQFPNATTMVEAIAEADFDRDVAAEVARLKKESGLFDKALDKAAVVTAAGGDPAAVALASFRAGERAAREVAKVSRPALVSDLLENYTRKEGVNPDVMASMFGYTSGEAMLRDILTSPPLEDAIETETNKRMEAEHSELADPKKLQQAVVEALAGEARGKLIASELRALLKATTPTQSMIRAAKEAARQKLLDTPVGEISTSSFVAAASRASKAAREALSGGDVAAAIEAQRRYLFQNELARLSIAIEKEVDSFLDGKVAKVFGSNEDIGKTRNMDVVNVARGLLGEHDLATTSQHERALSYLNVLKERAPEVHEKLAAFVEPVAAEAKPWRKMTLDRFRALASAVGVLWHEAKRGQEFRAYDGEMLLRSTVRERLVAAAQEAGLDTAKAAQFGDEASRWSWSDIKANLTRIEQWTITMDGGEEGGVWHRYVYRTLAHAYNNYLSAALEESKYWRDTLAQFENLSGPEIDAPELGEGVKFRNREHLLGTIMHMGNDSNLANVVLSEGWGSMQKSELAKAWGDGRGKSFLVSNWWNFVNAMLERGHITTRDIDVIQERIWDHNEKVLKPLLQDTNREVYGEYVAEIKAAPFTVLVNGQAFSYRGGYVPSKVDPNAPGNQSLFDRKGFEAIMDGQAQFQTQFASVPRGSTIERKEGVIRKRVLSLRLQGQHVDEVMRFAYVQPALTDVAALFRRGDVADFLNRTQPAAIRAIIAPALERVARNRIQAPMSKNLRAVEDGANALRRNASATFLGFSIKNALQQYTGLIQSLNYVSFGRLWSALWAYRGSNGATATRMFELSTAMRNSLSDEMVALNDEIALMYDPSVLNNVRRWSNRYMMVLQRWTQFQVNAITWNAAFDEQYAKLLPTMDPDKAKAEAIERADSIVRRAQGSRTPLDVANFTAGNAVMQLFTQFQDFPNLIANQIMEAKGAKAKAAAIMLSLLLPTLASGAIALGLAGGRVPGARTPDGDDDRDGRSDDEIAAYLFGEVMRGAGSLIPIVGAPVMQALGAGVSSRAELSPFPGFAIAEAHLRQLAKTSQRVATMFGLREPSRPSRDGAWSPTDARDWAAIVGTWTGLPMGPAGRAGSFIENVEAGRSQPDSWWRTVLGVLNGR